MSGNFQRWAARKAGGASLRLADLGPGAQLADRPALEALEHDQRLLLRRASIGVASWLSLLVPAAAPLALSSSPFQTESRIQLLLLHVIRLIHRQQPAALARCVFLRDGPLAFFGQTANLHAPFRAALEWMRTSAQINLVGLEKSGAFVDHAREIETRIPAGQALILSDDYIYRYIMPKGHL